MGDNTHKNLCKLSSEIEISKKIRNFKKKSSNDSKVRCLSVNELNQYHEIPVVFTESNPKSKINCIRPRAKSYHRNCFKNADYCWRQSHDDSESRVKTDTPCGGKICYYKTIGAKTTAENENLPCQIELLYDTGKNACFASSCPAINGKYLKIL